MRIAAAVCCAFWLLPLMGLGCGWIALLGSGQDIPGDSFLSAWIMGLCLAALAGTALSLLIGWRPQLAKILE